MGNEDDRVVSDNIKQIKVLKPNHPKVGRPKANQKPSQGEKKKASRHYSSCGGQGHNLSTCKYIMSALSTVNGLASKATQKN